MEEIVKEITKEIDNSIFEPEWLRGVCPQCGDALVSNCYYVGSRGYLICHECWSSLGPNPTCTYRKVL
jgi:RNase P subunit RPR2